MIGLPPQTKIVFYSAPTDMRKSHNGLCGLVRNELESDPTNGTLFLFVNRRRDRLKALYWDRDGLAIWYKRLERGTFENLRPDTDTKSIELDATDLAMLLSGISIESARRRTRFKRSA